MQSAQIQVYITKSFSIALSQEYKKNYTLQSVCPCQKTWHRCGCVNRRVLCQTYFGSAEEGEIRSWLIPPEGCTKLAMVVQLGEQKLLPVQRSPGASSLKQERFQEVHSFINGVSGGDVVRLSNLGCACALQVQALSLSEIKQLPVSMLLLSPLHEVFDTCGKCALSN